MASFAHWAVEVAHISLGLVLLPPMARRRPRYLGVCISSNASACCPGLSMRCWQASAATGPRVRCCSPGAAALGRNRAIPGCADGAIVSSLCLWNSGSFSSLSLSLPLCFCRFFFSLYHSQEERMGLCLCWRAEFLESGVVACLCPSILEPVTSCARRACVQQQQRQGMTVIASLLSVSLS